MSVDLICQGRAYRNGKWLPWHAISATVYENRMLSPRPGYQVRIAKATVPNPEPTTITTTDGTSVDLKAPWGLPS